LYLPQRQREDRAKEEETEGEREPDNDSSLSSPSSTLLVFIDTHSAIRRTGERERAAKKPETDLKSKMNLEVPFSH